MCVSSHHIYLPARCNPVFILRCSEHFCLPSQLMTVERLTLWNTEEVLRPSAGVWHGGGNKSAQDRAGKQTRISQRRLNIFIVVQVGVSAGYTPNNVTYVFKFSACYHTGCAKSNIFISVKQQHNQKLLIPCGSSGTLTWDLQQWFMCFSRRF